jgi:hypothetical protein
VPVSPEELVQYSNDAFDLEVLYADLDRQLKAAALRQDIRVDAPFKASVPILPPRFYQPICDTFMKAGWGYVRMYNRDVSFCTFEFYPPKNLP